MRVYNLVDNANMGVAYLGATEGFATKRIEIITSAEDKEIKIDFSQGGARDNGIVLVEEISLVELR